MAKHNFIARILCRLGGDKFTKESTEASLQQVLHEAQENIVHLDINNDKWILFSDLHKGAKNGADDFRRCESNYVTALDHYFEAGYRLCVMGDAEELWEEFPRTVIQHNHTSFVAESRFHLDGRYLRLWGNHDEIWEDPNTVRRLLQPMYGNKPLAVPEALLLEVTDGNKTLGKMLLIHGHQGTQNEGGDNRFAKWILHNFWRPLQVLTGFSCNTPATDWQLRRARDVLMYNWVAAKSGLILIAGHTHAPVFASYSHRARLKLNLSKARSKVETLTEDEQPKEKKRVEKLSSDLQSLESNLNPEERQVAEPLENPLPCYFNTGCCCFEDGDITGIEISDGEIRLVRWPDDDGGPRGKVLEASRLEDIFGAIGH
jgi:UDP-2,3-diacylglucosamine pyrophosphatase LpxH